MISIFVARYLTNSLRGPVLNLTARATARVVQNNLSALMEQVSFNELKREIQWIMFMADHSKLTKKFVKRILKSPFGAHLCAKKRKNDIRKIILRTVAK